MKIQLTVILAVCLFSALPAQDKKPLQKAGVPFESETYNWVGHGFGEGKSRIKYYERVATFLQKYLGK